VAARAPKVPKITHYLDQFQPTVFLPKATKLSRTERAKAREVAAKIVEDVPNWKGNIWSVPDDMSMRLTQASSDAADAMYPELEIVDTVIGHATWWPYREFVESLVLAALREQRPA